MINLIEEILAEHALILRRSIQQIREKLPSETEFMPDTEASDVVLFHFWQAIQAIIVTAQALCKVLNLGAPITYADAFYRLAKNGYIKQELALRLSDATAMKALIPYASRNKDILYNTLKSFPSDFDAFFASENKWRDLSLKKALPPINFPFLKNYPELQFLSIFASRGIGEVHEHSDWDFGFIGDEGINLPSLLNDLVIHLGTEQIDLVDVSKISANMRFISAQSGKLIFEREEGLYDKFWLQAVHFWSKFGPMYRAEYKYFLNSLRSGVSHE